MEENKDENTFIDFKLFSFSMFILNWALPDAYIHLSLTCRFISLIRQWEEIDFMIIRGRRKKRKDIIKGSHYLLKDSISSSTSIFPL